MRELDCRAQPCPVPVLRLAKAANEVGPGGRLLVRADDPAFPKDLRAWARSARSQILRFDDRGDCFEAVIAIGDDGGPGSLPGRGPTEAEAPRTRATPSGSAPPRAPSGPAPTALGPVARRRSRPASAPWMAELTREPRASLEPVVHAPPSASPHTPARAPISAAARVPSAPLTALGPVRQTFDLRGQPSKSLVEIVARACGRAEPGAILALIADQPEFGERLESLCQTIDATLLELIEREPGREPQRESGSGRLIEARVRIEAPMQRHPAAATRVARPGSAAGPTAEASAVPIARPTRPSTGTLPLCEPSQAPTAATVSRTAAVSRTSTRPTAAIAPSPATEPERCTLLVLHNDHEALLAALLIANGAAAAGMETSVFFTFWGLNLLRGAEPNLAEPVPRITLMQRLMKWMMPKGPARQPLGKMHFGGLGKGMLSSIMRAQQVMSLPELLASAEQLGVRFTACTMSMAVMGIAPRDLHPYPNLDYGGVASFVGDARGSAIHMVF